MSKARGKRKIPHKASSTAGSKPARDRRAKIEEPPPVRLIAIEDCQLWAVAGLERELDDFYVGLLNFERQQAEDEIIYRAENLRVRVGVLECPLPREDYRPLALAVDSLGALVGRLNDAKIEFVHHYGLTPGQDNLLISDPAGNPVEIIESRIAI
ncbi:MAG TPA: hypothetical protein VGG44_04020 [Tepidisphaeraceae bacterium]|jgi:hypothetical protein